MRSARKRTVSPSPDRAVHQTKWAIKPGSICWVGAANPIKGWDILHRLIGLTDYNFVIVRKDADRGPETGWHGRARYLYRLEQKELAEVMGACRVGLCTSLAETQHLAGLEMAACGLPVVSIYPVGVYAEEPTFCIVAGEEKVLGLLASALDKADPLATREAVMSGPWHPNTCKVAWQEVVSQWA